MLHVNKMGHAEPEIKAAHVHACACANRSCRW